MSPFDDSRTCGRIPIAQPVQLVPRGRSATYALVLNISLGGLLLSAAPSLPVGSPCKLVIPPAGDTIGAKILVEGTVIRNDSHGMAIRFANQLEGSTFEAIARQPAMSLMSSIAAAYLNYFKVSQNKNFQGSQELLGVSPSVFRRVFLTSFTLCIPLAILPVWVLKDSMYMIPDWLKIMMSFGYAAVWFAVIQPLVDLSVFRVISKRAFHA
ncbi:MAG: PilZ domain-containing protein [Holophagaceae bacterium]|uniref:PilZ domain-containing protein n=1 Tax=Candidatus Geothrix skivensis TaxID=2954439 RepID=A0A9D7SGG2_9BACT|nr:PilZ domain-containing protein [Candidatus Geothrix skivensis]